jgi:hypothetical protein
VLFRKGRFPLGGIFRLERNFSLSCDFSGETVIRKDKGKFAPRGKFRLVENGLKACFPPANFFARSRFFIVKIEKNLLKI